MQPSKSSTRTFRFGLFEADIANKTLTRNGVRVKIQDQPFRVLLLLLEHSGEIVSRDQLRSNLWQEGTFVDFDGSLNVILKKLRAALDDNPDNPRFIETIPRSGYRFIAPVTATRIEAPQSAEPVAPIDRPIRAAAEMTPSTVVPTPGFVPSSRKQQIRTGLLYAAFSSVILAGGIVAFTRWARPKQTASASSLPTNIVHLRRSVAVLGFQNLSPAPSEGWLGTAISEMLSTELAGGDQLRLISAEDVANLHAYSPWAKVDSLDRSTTSRIGTALGSDLLVLGSYATVGKPEHGQLRIDVRLQDCQSGEVVSEIAEIGATEDLFGLVSRIGGKLRNRLGIPLEHPSDELSADTGLPGNPEAARFYSLGLEKLRAYDFAVARGFFEQAVAAEPKFPLAHAMLSRADLFMGKYEQAKAEAKQGLDLATGLPRVQRMQIEASYDQATGNRGKAADIYRVLFNLFPDSLDYGLQLAKLQLESYHPEEALGTIHQLRQLPSPYRDDPLIDLREAGILVRKDLDTALKLYRTAAQKATAQGKKQVFARAEESLCRFNPAHVSSPPECREAYEAYVAAGNADASASSLQLMAENQRLTGHDAEAVPLYEQATRKFIEVGDLENAGVALNNASLVYENRGQFSLAEQQYSQARKYFEAVNDRVNASTAIANIADIEMWRGNFQTADQLYRQSWEMADETKTAEDQYPHIQHANLLLMKGQLDEATAEITPEIASLRDMKSDPWQTANALTALGEMQRHRGELDSSRKSFEEAVQILKGVNSSTAPSQINFAELAVDQGHFDEAESQLRAAISALEKDKDIGDEFSAYLVLAKSLLARGKVPESEAAIRTARELIDLHAFPVYSIPLRTLELRAKAAGAPAGKNGRDSLLGVQRELASLVQHAHQIGFYTAECEARLALTEIEVRLSSTSAGSHVSALSAEARQRGFLLYVSQAAKITPPPNIVAANKPLQ
ncbi:winged helix-turn-helix domain-containing protein [Occallatibacter savannae]|uniref:winged helix-turn-helix domain-containing protein n=1 Tax=Occallatibacter savannae TaxID=1002691 RepID=UPI0013A5A0DD|nr:winged helix-turn-helix domain-containing protein [Occallatibacter savannae]